MEETDLPEFSTKPSEERARVDKKAPHTVLVRLHQNDWEMLRLLLRRDGMSFQKFVSLCSRAYLEADPAIIKSIRTYRELELVPQDQRDKAVFSNRERMQIYAELEDQKVKDE